MFRDSGSENCRRNWKCTVLRLLTILKTVGKDSQYEICDFEDDRISFFCEDFKFIGWPRVTGAVDYIVNVVSEAGLGKHDDICDRTARQVKLLWGRFSVLGSNIYRGLPNFSRSFHPTTQHLSVSLRRGGVSKVMRCWSMSCGAFDSTDHSDLCNIQLWKITSP